jgi:2-polyprenyl-3-methyl-5-hydroxy-6-metoxy-1,4-benzoquinol methylase
MSRIGFAAEILRPLAPTSILDVGCRDGALADHFPRVDYWGADLLPSANGRVRIVGDIVEMQLTRRFDAIVACDILEHVDRPSELFDRLVGATDRLLLVSLPNTYDLKSRIRFAMRGRLGGKYEFLEQGSKDRHRWLMNRREILEFYRLKAAKHRLALRSFDLTYGSSRHRTLKAISGRLMASVLPASICAETVFGLFLKSADPAQGHRGAQA